MNIAIITIIILSVLLIICVLYYLSTIKKLEECENARTRLIDRKEMYEKRYHEELEKSYELRDKIVILEEKLNPPPFKIGNRVTMMNNYGDFVINDIQGNQAEIITNTTRQKVHVDTLKIYKPNKVS